MSPDVDVTEWLTIGGGGTVTYRLVATNSGGAATDEVVIRVLEPTVAIDGRMWTAWDNGQTIGWNEATRYCADLMIIGRVDDYTDWRLPTMDELESLYETNRNDPTGIWNIHIRSPFQLGKGRSSAYGEAGCCSWGSNRLSTAQDSNAALFNFDDGRGYNAAIDSVLGTRALCVRGSGE